MITLLAALPFAVVVSRSVRCAYGGQPFPTSSPCPRNRRCRRRSCTSSWPRRWRPARATRPARARLRPGESGRARRDAPAGAHRRLEERRAGCRRAAGCGGRRGRRPSHRREVELAPASRRPSRRRCPAARSRASVRGAAAQACRRPGCRARGRRPPGCARSRSLSPSTPAAGSPKAARSAHHIHHLLRGERAAAASFLRNVDSHARAAAREGLPSHPIHLVLDNVRSAYNVGSIFRTADTARVAEVVTCGFTPRPPHPKLEKTAFAALESVATRHFDSTLSAVAALRAEGVAVWCMETTDGALNYAAAGTRFPRGGALVSATRRRASTRASRAADAVVEIPTLASRTRSTSRGARCGLRGAAPVGRSRRSRGRREKLFESRDHTLR